MAADSRFNRMVFGFARRNRALGGLEEGREEGQRWHCTASIQRHGVSAERLERSSLADSSSVPPTPLPIWTSISYKARCLLTANGTRACTRSEEDRSACILTQERGRRRARCSPAEAVAAAPPTHSASGARRLYRLEAGWCCSDERQAASAPHRRDLPQEMTGKAGDVEALRARGSRCQDGRRST